MRGYVMIAVVCFVLLSSALCHAASDVDTHLAELRNAGIAAEQNKDYAKAVEAYRQVLYVDGNDARSQFGLAYALEQTGKLDDARREFKRFDAAVRNDHRLTREETQRFAAYTRDALVRLAGQKKGLNRSFMTIDILVITGLLWMVWAYKGLRCFQIWRQEREERGEMGRICLDAEWLARREKEVDRPVNWVTMVMLGLTIFFSVMTIRALFFK